jgi:phage tail protein X
MNRQVLPSMVLSVLIVCFFAVVLFPLERDREQAVKAGVVSKAAAPPVAAGPIAPPPSPPGAATAEPPPKAVAPTTIPSPSPAADPAASVSVESSSEPARPADVASPPERPRNPVLASAPSGEPSGASTSEVPRVPAPPAAFPVPVHVPVSAPVAPVSVVEEPAQVEKSDEPPPVVVAKSKEKEKAPEPARPEASPLRSEPVSIPRSDPDVTIVDHGETLDDVAIRVYGTRAGVETLLRANREVLTRRKGPLRTGLQLWTPAR